MRRVFLQEKPLVIEPRLLKGVRFGLGWFWFMLKNFVSESISHIFGLLRVFPMVFEVAVLGWKIG